MKKVFLISRSYYGGEFDRVVFEKICDHNGVYHDL